MEKRKGIEKRLQNSFNDHIKTLPNDEAALVAGQPGLVTAIQRASIFYTPVDSEIMERSADEVNFEEFKKLIKINPEYITTKFAREHIRNLRIMLYSPIEREWNTAKDELDIISRTLSSKSRNHYPKEHISSHRHNIKQIFEQIWNSLPNMKSLSYFLRENFSVDITEDHDIGENSPLVETPAYWANFAIEKLYGLSEGTATRYASSPPESDSYIKRLQHNMNEMTKPIT